MTNDYTDLLGSELIAAGYRLHLANSRLILTLNAKDILSWGRHVLSLKTVKEIARLYLAVRKSS